MKKKRSDKVSRKVNQKEMPLKKSLGQLMKDEDGFVSKKTILKVGLSTVAALGMTGAVADVGQAGHYSATHSNFITIPATPSTCVNHQNITTHTY
jgi:hypothetical protein